MRNPDTLTSTPSRRRTGAAVWSALLALGLGLSGCGASAGSPPDASTPEEPAPTLRLEVGTGIQFTSIQDGGTLELVRGCQGSQHVYVSLRAWNLVPRTALAQLSLSRASDGQAVSSPYEVRLPFQPGEGADAPVSLEGLALVVPFPDQAVGQRVSLSASVESESGARASDTRSATLQWSASQCR